MPIRFRCLCGNVLTVPDSYAGKTGRCRHCQHEQVVPPPSAGEPIPRDQAVRNADGTIKPFDTGWRSFRNGKFMPVASTGVVTPLSGVELGGAANPSKKAGPK